MPPLLPAPSPAPRSVVRGVAGRPLSRPKGRAATGERFARRALCVAMIATAGLLGCATSAAKYGVRHLILHAKERPLPEAQKPKEG